jgi:hypothetical protein
MLQEFHRHPSVILFDNIVPPKDEKEANNAKMDEKAG